MSRDNLVVETSDRVTTVTVNRPKVLNALDTKTLGELRELFGELASDQESRVVILTGAGEKAFVAGADISEMKGMEPRDVLRYSQLGMATMRAIEMCRKPTIAAVNGYALGGGLELAMACDLIYASERAKLGQPEVNLGIMPGWGGTQRLPRVVGRRAALEMLLTGDPITAQEALTLGLVNRIVPADKLLSTAREVAAKIAAKGRFAMAQIKRSVASGADMGLEAALAFESQLFSMCFTTPEHVEGLNAFLEKRTPNFE